MFIHLVVIAWLYVTVMMAVAEATAPNGTVLGALFTLLLYGVLPVVLVVYLLATPARRRALKEKEAAAQAAARAAASASATADSGGVAPDQRSEAPGAAEPVAPVRKEP